MKIAIVNLDKGVDGTNQGSELVKELKDKDVMDICEVSQDEANEGLQNAEYYATITIPSNFTEFLNSAKEEDKKVSKSEQKNKEVEKSKKTKKKRNSILIAIIIGIPVILGIVISTIFALLNIRNDKIVSGVSISGIEVSGLSKEEAKGKIEAMYQEKKEEEIDIKYEDFETTLNPTLLEVNYNIDKAIEDAYLVGRKDNIFFNNYDILYTLLCKKNINVDMTLNEEVAKQNIEDIGVNLPGVVVESSYSVEDDELIITKGKAGVKIDTEKLLDEIKERLNDVNLKEEIIEIPVLNKEPESIDIDKIHEEIYTEAKDAYYTKNPFAVYPEVEGIDFDVEEAKALLEEEKEEYVIKLKITKPKVTISQIGSEAFPDQLATFTTRFDVSDVDRSTNLKIACQKINGKVILSGDTFSYNKALGARTAAAGYKNGKIYSGGQVVDGIGGGICQISSTLYNSVLLADLEIVERRNHQFVTSYVGPGRDATVVYGLTDFKFKNTRQYPVRISASAQNGIATISIYGIKEENEYTFKFSTKTVATIPFSVRYVEDESLDVGTEKVKQKGTNGLKTETYITKMLNGKVISTKLLSRDTYDAMERIIIKGTKSANNKTTNVTEGTTESVESSTNTTEEKQPETTPSGNTTTTETNTTPTTESKE